MEILSVRHRDFTLNIECGKFDGVLSKARGNISPEGLVSRYKWSDDVESIKYRWTQWELSGRERVGEALFFDNADYAVWVDFGGRVDEAWMRTYGGGEATNFRFISLRI